MLLCSQSDFSECFRWVWWIPCGNLDFDDVVTQGLRLDEIRTHKWTIFRCSAMTGLNLHEGLEWLVQDAKDRLFLY